METASEKKITKTRIVILRRDDFINEYVFEEILGQFHDGNLSEFHQKNINEVTISDAKIEDYIAKID